MLKKAFLLVVMVAALCAVSTAAGAVEYRLHDLGTGMRPMFINNAGQAVGTLRSSDGYGIGVWENGVISDRGSYGREMQRINITNDVVRILEYTRLLTDGVVTEFETGFHAMGLNDNGDVAGSCGHAALWHNGSITDLGTLGGSSGCAYAVNNHKQVVGFADTSDSPLDRHAFLWNNGEMVDLGTLGGSFGCATAINEHGQVAGTSETADWSRNAFIWQNGTMTALPGLYGNGSGAIAINNSGVVAGYSHMEDGRTHATVWQDGVATDLNGLDGTSSTVFGINDSGWICGIILTGDGNTHGVLWEPVPEPGSIFALLSGLGGLGLVLRRRAA